MYYVLLTVYDKAGHSTAIVKLSERYNYIDQAGKAAYAEWCKLHGVTPGKDTTFDCIFLGSGIEFINCVEG